VTPRAAPEPCASRSPSPSASCRRWLLNDPDGSLPPLLRKQRKRHVNGATAARRHRQRWPLRRSASKAKQATREAAQHAGGASARKTLQEADEAVNAAKRQRQKSNRDARRADAPGLPRGALPRGISSANRTGCRECRPTPPAPSPPSYEPRAATRALRRNLSRRTSGSIGATSERSSAASTTSRSTRWRRSPRGWAPRPGSCLGERRSRGDCVERVEIFSAGPPTRSLSPKSTRNPAYDSQIGKGRLRSTARNLGRADVYMSRIGVLH